MSLSLEELEEGRRVAALVVKHCGKRYLPLFDMFDREIENFQTQSDRLTYVLRSQAPIRRVQRRRPRK